MHAYLGQRLLRDGEPEMDASDCSPLIYSKNGEKGSIAEVAKQKKFLPTHKLFLVSIRFQGYEISKLV